MSRCQTGRTLCTRGIPRSGRSSLQEKRSERVIIGNYHSGIYMHANFVKKLLRRVCAKRPSPSSVFSYTMASTRPAGESILSETQSCLLPPSCDVQLIDLPLVQL